MLNNLGDILWYMAVNNEPEFHNVIPAIAGLVGGMVVITVLFYGGDLAGLGISAILILYTLAAGGITLGSIAGWKIINHLRVSA